MDAKQALEMFEKTKSYWSDVYNASKVDVRLSIGLDLWTDREIKARGGEENCISLPVLPQFIHQVTNDMKQNTPSINVIPGEGSESDINTAKAFKGLIRNIEYKSKADGIYDTAGDCSVRGGFGFIGVDHDYVSEDSFLQELKLRRFQNPQSVYIDENSVEIDGSDAEKAYVLDTISKSAFERKYPGKQFISFDTEKTEPNAESIKICELFIKEYSEEEKQLNDDGSTAPVTEDDSEKKVRKRKFRKVKICRYVFSGEETLEETTFPGKYIPIVPVVGEEVWENGKRHWMSLIRQAKGAQRRLNKWATKESEILDMASIAPIMAPVGSVDDFMDEWGNPGSVEVARYRQIDQAGNQLNKPERINPAPVPTGVINAMQGAKDSVKEALGMYNASIGQKSNAISGVAYDAQKTEADVATFHFADNRNKSIEHVGRIIVSAAPEVYDTDRIIRIIGEEEEPKLIGINGAPMQEGQKAKYDLRKGQYDVRVTTGASYTTKRQESAAILGELIKQDPQAKLIFGDLWAKNLDVAGSEAIAERFKKVMPPNLTQDDENADPQVMALTQQLQQVTQQAQAQIQALQAELQSKQGDLAIKQGELQIKAKETEIKGAEVQIKAMEAQKAPEAQPDNTADVMLKMRELDIKEYQAQQAAKNDEIKNLIEMEKLKLSALQMQMNSNTNEPQDPEEDTSEDDMMEATQKAEQTAVLAGIMQRIEALTAAISQPINIVRDDQGNVAGIA